MSTPQQHRLIGQVIAERYRIEELLGQGGMGAVYIAQHLSLHKQVALKVVHPEHAGNAELAARFAREAMATSRIDHPNVISAIDFGTLPDGTAFLAVQLVRGPSLSKILQAEGRIHWARAAEIGSQIADALCAAHGHGIVHRDLKPDNVLLQFLDDGGELVKVLDFGVAKFARESLAPQAARSDSQVTQMGIIIGTPGYMAPEQAIGTPADHRSDLYALGVILWECVVGEALWSGVDLQALVEKQLSETPRRLRDVVDDPSLPGLLEDLVASLLARRAEERPADATIVREQLRAIAELDSGENPRWRSGARRVTSRATPAGLREPTGSQRDGSGARNYPTAPLREPTGSQREGSGARNYPTAPQREPTGHEVLPVIVAAPVVAAPAVSPAPVTSRRPGRSSRPAWLVTLLVTTILAGAVFLVVTGQVELRPQGQVAQVAETVAKQLNLPPPSSRADDEQEIDPKTGLPAAIAPMFDKLVAAEERDNRLNASNAVLSHLPLEEVPLYVRRMAYLQLAKTCASKREEIEKLAEIGDPRALPLLIRISQKPRGGCGRKHREDCLACLRKPLEQLISELERKQKVAY